ncbi:restriction endonuclease subunit S [Parabacteroides distasonis]|uniref:restriction endonuclease subunit S n=1 Tax=Parabacteroides distasonis TaxID=823 RepID=UPI001E30B205|nr:restriction endonuclease subunit S [Parabacteroides distasonis]
MRKYKLGDIATVEISGVDKKIKDGEKEIRLCNFVDVYYNWAITTAQHDSFMLATARPNEISKFKLKKGQVALTKDSETRDDIGIPTYIADDFDDAILGYHCALVTPNKDILDGRYLNALLHTDYAKKYFACNASGSGQRYALSVEALNSFPVPIIPLHEQKQIGEIFSALDKKIELNKRINQNLEAVIADVMDYKFLSNAETLPKRFIGDIASIKAGGDCPQEWSKYKTKDCQIPIYSNGTDNEGLYGYTKEPTILKRGITVAARGTIGYCTMRNGGYVPIIRLLAVTPNDIGGDVYLHQIFNRIKFRNDGSIQQQLTVPSLASIEIPYPNASTLKAFANITYPLIEKIKQNKIQIEELTKQRDELLPLLMNGQVSVNSDLSHD